MSERSFESSPESPRLSGAVGDVLAARVAARALLTCKPAAAADASLATLFLTAALLHCAILGGGEARRRDVADYLG